MDKLSVINYTEYENKLPQSGRHIIGSETDEGFIVYQAYRPSIAEFALENQFFGGEFRLSRMSWVKPNFLWMMYRSGWASKAGQEHVLAIEIKKQAFFEILDNAVNSSFDISKYGNIDNWRKALSESSVRLQWDPDHDPKGKKLDRKAIQLGLKDEYLKHYSKDWILSIQDISKFVKEQGEKVSRNLITELQVIEEKVIDIPSEIREIW